MYRGGVILGTAKIEAPSNRAGSRKRPVKRSVRPRGAYATPLGFASNYAARSIVARFGSGSDERETEICELLRFVEAAKAVGVRRLLVNGSFVTGKLSPNDVDVVFLPGPDYPMEGQRLDSDDLVWPFLQVIVAADDDDFEAWGLRQFATDRRRRPKGVVEVIL